MATSTAKKSTSESKADSADEVSGKPLQDATMARAFANIELTPDPVASSLQASFEHSVEVGINRDDSLEGILDLRLLNRVLRELDRPTVTAAGLGEE